MANQVLKAWLRRNSQPCTLLGMAKVFLRALRATLAILR